MKKNSFVFLTENFGYGPITTLCLIAEYLRNKVSNEFVFMGPKECAEKAKNTGLFDKIIEMNYSQSNIVKNKDIFTKAEKIIAVETTDILIFLINNYKLDNIYLVDNLFWMWDFLEPELKKLKKYYISNVLDCSYNKKRIAKDFNNIIEVGALRKYGNFKHISGNNLLITLGGVESYMIDDNIINTVYLDSIKTILKNKHISKFEHIYIAGGKNIINFLKKKIKDDRVIINTFDYYDYLDILYNSSYVIMSPGLGNFNEIISTDINCMLLLPINYSQYMQKKKFMNMKVGFHSQNNVNEKIIDEFLAEEEGVNQVIKNLHRYDINNFNKELNEFFVGNTDFDNRKKVFNSIDRNGIEEVCEDLLRG